MSFAKRFDRFRRLTDNASKYETYVFKEKLRKELEAADRDFAKGKMSASENDLIHALYKV